MTWVKTSERDCPPPPPAAHRRHRGPLPHQQVCLLGKGRDDENS